MFSGKLRARMEVNEARRCGYDNLAGYTKAISKNFKDVLHIETVGEEGLFVGMDNVKVVYNGSRHPVTRMEQLAFDLVLVVKESVVSSCLVSQGCIYFLYKS